MIKLGGGEGTRSQRLVVSRVWGSARGSARHAVSGSLSFSNVPLDVLRRIVEAQVAK